MWLAPGCFWSPADYSGRGEKSWTSRKLLGLQARPQCSSPSGHIWQVLFPMFPGSSEWTSAADMSGLLPASSPPYYCFPHLCLKPPCHGHSGMPDLQLRLRPLGLSTSYLHEDLGDTEVPKVLDVRGMNLLSDSGYSQAFWNLCRDPGGDSFDPSPGLVDQVSPCI